MAKILEIQFIVAIVRASTYASGMNPTVNFIELEYRVISAT